MRSTASSIPICGGSGSESRAFFFSAYSRSVRDENAAFQKLLTERNIDFATAMPGKLAPGSVTFSTTGEEVVHNDFVTKAWVDDPLKDVLAKISGYSRTPPPKTNPTPLSELSLSLTRVARSETQQAFPPTPTVAMACSDRCSPEPDG